MNPFRVTDETRAMVLDNTTVLLSRFLACPELDYVIFSWVMHQPVIFCSILNRLELHGVKVLQYTLLCLKQTLFQRIEQDIQADVRHSDALKRSLTYLPCYDSQNTVKLMTGGGTPQETAEWIVGRDKKNKC